MKKTKNKYKAELCSKRGSDENVAGNRRAMRRSNSWGGSNVELIKQPAERVFESGGSEPPVTLKIVKSMDRTKDLSCRRQCDKVTITPQGKSQLTITTR